MPEDSLPSVGMSRSDSAGGGDHVQIRTQQPGDGDAVCDVLTRSFKRAVVADLAEALHDARPEHAALSFVAELDGDVVGHIQLSRSWLDAPERLVEVLVLSPLGVAPEHQGQGIGGRLVRHAVNEAAHLAPMIFLKGSPDYYSRFGFEIASRRGFTPASMLRVPTRPSRC